MLLAFNLATKLWLYFVFTSFHLNIFFLFLMLYLGMSKAYVTRKQKRFVQEYITDYRPKDAAIRAGYKIKNAAKVAYDLLNKTHISQYLEVLEKDAAERNKVTKDYLVTNLKKIVVIFHR